MTHGTSIAANWTVHWSDETADLWRGQLVEITNPALPRTTAPGPMPACGEKPSSSNAFNAVLGYPPCDNQQQIQPI